ncbi:stomatin-like [Anolis sagrei]|uniref:stomatin-like n=1 Tax=Anolis sagrei TaxID=38937 RepID=UPI0035224253
MEEAQPVEKEFQDTPNPPAIVGRYQGRAEKLDQSLEPGEWVLVLLSYLILILTFPVSVWMCLQIVNEYEQVVILRLGHMWKGGEVRPGVYFILPCIDILIRVDMRTRFLDLPLHEVLTKDPLSLEIDGAIYYRIHNPVLVIRNVTDPDSAILLLTQTTLGDVLKTKYLSQIICNRDNLAQNVQSIVDNTIGSWGITLENLEIKTVKTKVKSEHPVAKHGGSPASSAGSTTPPCSELKEKEGQAEPSQTVKESLPTDTEMPTSFKLDCVQKETTDGETHESLNQRAQNSLQNQEKLEEGPSLVKD